MGTEFTEGRSYPNELELDMFHRKASEIVTNHPSYIGKGLLMTRIYSEYQFVIEDTYLLLELAKDIWTVTRLPVYVKELHFEDLLRPGE